MATARCHACRRPIPAGARVCPGCGELVRTGLGAGAKLGLVALLGLGAGVAWVATQGWPDFGGDDSDPAVTAEAKPPEQLPPTELVRERGETLPPLGDSSRRIDGGELEIAGARLELSPKAVEGGAGIGLVRTTRDEAGALAASLASDIYYLSANGRGRLVDDARLGIDFDPAALAGGEPQAYAVTEAGALIPVFGVKDEARSRIWVDAPEVNVEGATAVLHRRTPAVGDPDAPPPSPVGYAVAPRGVATKTCKHGKAGESHQEPGGPVLVHLEEDAPCDLVRSMAKDLAEAHAAYGRDYADAGGSPLRRYTERTPMWVYVGEYSSEGVYSSKSWNGRMFVGAKQAKKAKDLRGTLWHEMFHAVQDHTANMAYARMSAAWWYEATAEWAGLSARGVKADAAATTLIEAYKGLLSTPIQRSFGVDETTTEYGWAVLIYHAQAIDPGYVKAALQNESLNTSAALYGDLVAKAKLSTTWVGFLEGVLKAAGLTAKTAGAIAVRPNELWRNETGKEKQPVPLPDDGRSIQNFSGAAGPLTAHFFRLHPHNNPPKTSAVVRVRVDGKPSDAAFVMRGGSVSRITSLGITIPSITETRIVVFNDDVAATRNFTVTMEIEQTVEKPAAVAGSWDSSYGCVALEQTDRQVKGKITYKNGSTGTLSGKLTGKRLEFRWSHAAASGKGTLTANSTDSRLTGNFIELAGGKPKGEPGSWKLTKRSKACPASKKKSKVDCYENCVEMCKIDRLMCRVGYGPKDVARVCDKFKGVGSVTDGGGFYNMVTCNKMREKK